jgi:hypothetical protein
MKELQRKACDRRDVHIISLMNQGRTQHITPYKRLCEPINNSI